MRSSCFLWPDRLLLIYDHCGKPDHLQLTISVVSASADINNRQTPLNINIHTIQTNTPERASSHLSAGVKYPHCLIQMHLGSSSSPIFVLTNRKTHFLNWNILFFPIVSSGCYPCWFTDSKSQIRWLVAHLSVPYIVKNNIKHKQKMSEKKTVI